MGGRSLLCARAAVLIMGCAWTVPFLYPYHPLPVTAFYSEWLAVLLGLAAASVRLLAPGWSKNFPVPGVAVGLTLLALLYLAHGILGHALYAGNALNAVRYLLWGALIAVLGATLRRDIGLPSVAIMLAWSLLVGGMATAAAALIQHYHWDTPFNFLVAPKIIAAVYGNLGHYGHFANYVSLALISAVYLYGRGALHAAIAFGCIAILLVVLALSGSRSAWLYLVAVALFALAWHRHVRHAESARVLKLSLLLIPVFMLAQWVAKLPFMQAPEGVVTAGERLFELATGTGPRLLLARVAWETFVASPLVGAGPGHFAWQFFEASAQGDAPFYGLHRHAHNVVLHLLAQTGITGAGVMLAVVVIWVRNFGRAPLDLHRWWLLTLLGVIGVHSLLEDPLWYAYFLGIAAFLLGMGETRFAAARPRVVPVLTAASLILGGYALFTACHGFRSFERALHASAEMTPEVRDKIISEQLLRNRRDLVLAPYAELILSRSLPLSEQDLDKKIELNTRVMHFAPVAAVVFRQAVLLALAGDQAGAEAHYRRLWRVYPAALPRFTMQLNELATVYPDKLAPLVSLAIRSLDTEP